MDETTSSSVGLTLGGILSIKQTPPYRIHARTLLDLIRDDQTCGKESKNTWKKMFRDKLRFKHSGSAVSSAVAPHAHVSTDRSVSVSDSVSDSPPVNDNISSVPDTQPVVQVQVLQTEPPVEVTEVGRVAASDGGGTAAVRMSLMSLLEVEASAYMNDNGGEEEEEVVTVEETGGGGGGGYNNCCVCMVRHKGAAFIPCGHTFCRLCSRELFVKRASCPLCNNLILEILDIF
ncbi:putative transcription factor C2H2 family [Helianthus annuus]|nr:putative transcription factor C2H2 family [Helianthus annuus]